MRTPRPVYDRIGGRYVGGRQPDPRIAARIEQALGAAAGAAPCVRGTAEALPFADGAWREAYGHLLERDELDLGYRVIVA